LSPPAVQEKSERSRLAKWRITSMAA
jgi:hypothetical protein